MSDQWQVEPSRPGMLGRLLVPDSPTKPAVTAFLAGVAGAGAFVASLVLDWQKITVTEPSSIGPPSSALHEFVLTAGVGSLDILGFVYILGMLGLLTLLGSVLTRPDSALRIRMGAVGLGVGLAGVLVAVTLRMKETVFNLQGMLGGLSSAMQQEVLARTSVAYDKGMFAGFAAVVLLSAAVWLAGLPSAQAAARRAAFAAADPSYHSAQFQGGQMNPPQAAPIGVTLGPAGNGPLPAPPPTAADPVGPVPVPAQGYSAPTAPYPPPSPQDHARPPSQPYAPPSTPPYAPAPPANWTRAGHVDELSVTPSEPLDPDTSPDMWRRG